MNRRMSALASWSVVWMCLIGWTRTDAAAPPRAKDADRPPPASPPSGNLDHSTARALAGEFIVSSTVTHENLSVVFIRSPKKTKPAFITYRQGHAARLVTIRESADPTVGTLTVQNHAKLPLYLHEGERFYGGKQDRILYSSVVIPPRSGQVTIPVYCVEKGRWQTREGGRFFRPAPVAAMAPAAVRQSARYAKDQDGVWANVAAFRRQFAERRGRGYTAGSLSGALDDPAMTDAIAPYVRAMEDALPRDGQTLGAAFAIHGVVREVNLYADARLFESFYPALLRSFAAEAYLERGDPRDEPSPPQPAPTLDPREVSRFIRDAAPVAERAHRHDADNHCDLADLDGRFFARTSYRGRIVHLQWSRPTAGVTFRPADPAEQTRATRSDYRGEAPYDRRYDR